MGLAPYGRPTFFNREKFLDLVRISDIVVENFSLRVLKNLNLEFQTLLNVNPSLIMLRMPGYGTFGEYSMFPANGSCIELMTGIPENHCDRSILTELVGFLF